MPINLDWKYISYEKVDFLRVQLAFYSIIFLLPKNDVW